MWEQVIADMLLKESGFAFLGRSNSGDIREIVPIPWSAIRPERYNGSGRLKYYINDITTYGADQDDILHFPGFGFDGIRAKSVISYAARNAAGNAMAMDEYSGKFFAGGAHPSIVLSTDKGMKEEQKLGLQMAFLAKYSGMDNAHRLPLVLTEGLKASNLSMSAEDAQLLESRKYQVVDIARAFGVPPHLIGETSASTSWGSGLEEMSRAFITFTVNQHLRRIEQELNRKIYPRSQRFYLEFFRDALMEGNSKAQSDYYRAAIGGPGSGPGWMTVDEVRKSRHLPPMNGEAAKLFYPTATTKQTGTGEPKP
jgi:HK97 family phage portal protein